MKKIIYIAAIILMMAACRSHKEASFISKEHILTHSDSISADTETISVANKTETLSLQAISSDSGEKIDFLDKGGEISFHPDGKITLSGVATYSKKRNVNQSQISSKIKENDSVRINTDIELSRSSAISSTGSEKPLVRSVKLNLFYLIAFLVLMAFSLRILWRRLKN